MVLAVLVLAFVLFELLAVDAPSPRDTAFHPATGRDPFDQTLPGDDGTWSA